MSDVFFKTDVINDILLYGAWWDSSGVSGEDTDGDEGTERHSHPDHGWWQGHGGCQVGHTRILETKNRECIWYGMSP